MSSRISRSASQDRARSQLRQPIDSIVDGLSPRPQAFEKACRKFWSFVVLLLGTAIQWGVDAFRFAWNIVQVKVAGYSFGIFLPLLLGFAVWWDEGSWYDTWSLLRSLVAKQPGLFVAAIVIAAIVSVFELFKELYPRCMRLSCCSKRVRFCRSDVVGGPVLHRDLILNDCLSIKSSKVLYFEGGNPHHLMDRIHQVGSGSLQCRSSSCVGATRKFSKKFTLTFERNRHTVKSSRSTSATVNNTEACVEFWSCGYCQVLCLRQWFLERGDMTSFFDPNDDPDYNPYDDDMGEESEYDSMQQYRQEVPLAFAVQLPLVSCSSPATHSFEAPTTDVFRPFRCSSPTCSAHRDSRCRRCQFTPHQVHLLVRSEIPYAVCGLDVLPLATEEIIEIITCQSCDAHTFYISTHSKLRASETG
jgi:hypothetical protein